MTHKLIRIIFLFLLVIAGILAVAPPDSVHADGGAIAPYFVWSSLHEAQQLAVVTLGNGDTARIDLFISILDKTKESHEIIFFLPLGAKATDFYAVEEDVNTFDSKCLASLDKILSSDARNKQWALHILFAGTLITNGAVLIPIWSPLLISACSTPATTITPEATFNTESSQIGIYGIDDNTDLEALISTVGLQSSVQQTLESLRGQRIAVIKLKTNPLSKSSVQGAASYRDPGLHLSWTSAAVKSESVNVFTYPLGTGKAWSKPIERTRVYVVAPQGTDFDVNYPKYGSNQSGYKFNAGPKIEDYHQVPSYSVDEAIGSYGRVWRATYTQSNPDNNIIIYSKPQTAMSSLISTTKNNIASQTLTFSLIFSILIWMLSWHYLMPRFIGRKGMLNPRLQWYYGLIYPGINAVLILTIGAFLFIFFAIGLRMPALLLLFLFCSGFILWMYWLIHARNLDVSTGRAFKAFILTSLIGNGCYMVFAMIFAALVGII